jgi:hypothetical protein
MAQPETSALAQKLSETLSQVTKIAIGFASALARELGEFLVYLLNWRAAHSLLVTFFLKHRTKIEESWENYERDESQNSAYEDYTEAEKECSRVSVVFEANEIAKRTSEELPRLANRTNSRFSIDIREAKV